MRFDIIKPYLEWHAANGTQYDYESGEFDMADGWQKLTLGFRLDEWVAVWLNDLQVRQVTGITQEEAFGKIGEISRTTPTEPVLYLAEVGPSTAIIHGSEPSSCFNWPQLATDTIGLPPGVDPTILYCADLSAWELDGPPRFAVELDGNGEVITITEHRELGMELKPSLIHTVTVASTYAGVTQYTGIRVAVGGPRLYLPLMMKEKS